MKYMPMVCFAFVIGVGAVTEVIADNHKKQKTEQSLDINNVSEDDDIEIGVEVTKDVGNDEGNYDDYEIHFYIDGDRIEDAKKVQIKTPIGKKAELRNKLGFNNMEFEVDSGQRYSLDDLKNKFPEGNYTIQLFPKKFGSKSFNLAYDFPATPVITYPENDSTNIPLPFTMEWETLDDNIDGLLLEVEDGNESYAYETYNISTNATSFTIPEGVLLPNTRTRIELTIFKSDGNGYTISSKRIIHFTTASE